jgi:hypothetical protein
MRRRYRDHCRKNVVRVGDVRGEYVLPDERNTDVPVRILTIFESRSAATAVAVQVELPQGVGEARWADLGLNQPVRGRL